MSIITILSPSDTVDLTTLATVKDELGVTGGTPSDATLARWIHEVSAQIASYCHRTFGREVVREAFSLTTSRGPIRLSRFPVAMINSVTERGVLLTTTDWEAELDAGLVYRLYFGGVDAAGGYRGEWWDPNVVIEYQAGFQLLGELPYDIERAALLLMRYRTSAGQRDPLVRSEAIPGKYQVSYWVGSVPGSDASMPPDVADILDPYIDQIV